MADHPLCMEARELELAFLTAAADGAAQLSTFNSRLIGFIHRLRDAQNTASLPSTVLAMSHATLRSVILQAQELYDFESAADDLRDDDDPSVDRSSPAAALPLFRYLLDNICHPYPDAEEKESLVAAAREAGWEDFDRKKCEDWLNRKRHQSGYVAIARKYCDEDTDAMRNLCHAALFGSPEHKAHVHPDALEEIEEMYDVLESQFYELNAQEVSPWVEDLAHGLRDFLDLPAAGGSASDSLFEDNEEVDNADCSDDEDSGSNFSDTDADSDYDADTDCDDDEVVNEVVVCARLPLVGAKRKLSNLPRFAQPHSRPLSRTPSSASSSSSSSSTSSSVSFRSFSGRSVSSATSCEEDECERPAKRSRSESFSPEPASPVSDSQTTTDLWVMRAPSNAVGTSKRKRDDDDLETLARNMKRSRYAALSAAAPSNIPAHHLTSLTDVCTRSWSSVVPFEVLGFSVDSELYTVDCTAIQAAADEEEDDEDNNLADIIGLCNDPDAPDDATWATVQLHALAQTLTGSRLPMPAELCADTVEVKLEELSPQELSSLGETLATTAESITAEYPLDQSLLLEDDDAFSPPELSDGESSGSSSPDRSPSPPVELESSPERLMADYAMSQRKELDPLQHPWFAQMFGQQGLSFFDPNTFRVECNPPPGMMAQESHPDFLAQLDL